MQPPSPGPEGAQAFGFIPQGWVLGSDGQRSPSERHPGPGAGAALPAAVAQGTVENQKSARPFATYEVEVRPLPKLSSSMP